MMIRPIFELLFLNIQRLILNAFKIIVLENDTFKYKIKKWVKNNLLYISLLLALLFVIVAFYGYFVVWEPGFGDVCIIGQTGDSFGIMNLFIAIADVLLIFAAFWVHYNSNRKMLNDSAMQQLERQFYEMLKIHRDNVNRLEWKILRDETEYDFYKFQDKEQKSEDICKNNFKYCIKKLDHISSIGQDVLRLYLNEFLLAYECVNNIPKEDKPFNLAYQIFFEGLDKVEIDKEAEIKLREVKESVNKGNFDNSKLTKSIITRGKNQGRCNIFEGHRAVLNPYYRHLFYSARSIVESKVFDEPEKMNYLKILRSQMTSEEQTLLLVNWHAGYGTEWEYKAKDKRENHFLTKYKMIHNIEKKDFETVLSVEELKNLLKTEDSGEEDMNVLFEFDQRKNKF